MLLDLTFVALKILPRPYLALQDFDPVGPFSVQGLRVGGSGCEDVCWKLMREMHGAGAGVGG